VTGDPADEGAFRTPGARRRLPSALLPRRQRGHAGVAIDAILAHGMTPVPIQLTPAERLQLLTFVRALSPERRPYPRPQAAP
jgi:hypothetical protein